MCVILLPNPGTPSSFFVTNEVIILFSCADCTNDQVSILRANSLIPASKSGENGRKNRGITIEACYMWRVDNFSCVVCVDRASTLQVEDGYAKKNEIISLIIYHINGLPMQAANARKWKR
jgi:hypothetical protein